MALNFQLRQIVTKIFDTKQIETDACRFVTFSFKFCQKSKDPLKTGLQNQYFTATSGYF